MAAKFKLNTDKTWSQDPNDITSANPTGSDSDAFDQSSNDLTDSPVSLETGTSTSTVTLAGSAMVFNNTYGSGVSPAFMAAIVTAENFLQSHFSNAVTLNVSFDLGPLSAAFSAENHWNDVPNVSYATLVNALKSHATTADDFAAIASLPAADPTGGEGFAVPLGEARVLGLASNASGIDDTITLNQSLPWTYGADAVGALEHEISEGEMGRIGGLGIQNDAWGIMDLFRYSAPGQRDYTGGEDGLPTYFSVDGDTLLTQFHNSVNTSGVFDGMDFGDWDNTVGDAFGPTGPGSPGTVSATDLRVLDIIGWTPSGDPSEPPVADFNGDGKSDILWQNNAGAVVEWQMNGLQVVNSQEIGGGGGWNIAGTGDFNGDGNADILWQNSAGTVDEWEMNGFQVLNSAIIGGGPGWNVVGTGDFDGSGKSGILWQNSAGAVVAWQMNGLQQTSSAVIGGAPGWNVVGTGDFNGDGMSDILWQNTSGTVAEWQMDGFQPVSMQFIGGSSDWKVVATGDFNGDGKSDILWENALGTVDEWLMNGTQVIGSAIIGGGGGWNFAGVGDYNGDGKSDILWQNTSGTLVEWEMNGTQVLNAAVIGTIPGGKVV